MAIDDEAEEDPAIERAMAAHIGPKAGYFMPIWGAYRSSPPSGKGRYGPPLNWIAYLGGPFWKLHRGLTFDGWMRTFWMSIGIVIGSYWGWLGSLTALLLAWFVFGLGTLFSGTADYLRAVHHRALIARRDGRPMRRRGISGVGQIVAAALLLSWLLIGVARGFSIRAPASSGDARAVR